MYLVGFLGQCLVCLKLYLGLICTVCLYVYRLYIVIRPELTHRVIVPEGGA